MGSKLYHVLFCLVLMQVQLALARRYLIPELVKRMEMTKDDNVLYTPHSTEVLDYEPEGVSWKTHTTNKDPKRCKNIKPTPRDIVRRIYAILPYFDRDHQHAKFLQKYRSTINKMSDSVDMVDREAAYYAAILTPILFLQPHRDVRCLLERFERSLREFQTFAPTEKRTALKHLRNLRELSNKIRMFVGSQPGKATPTRTPALEVQVNEDIQDKKETRFLRELIKNLG